MFYFFTNYNLSQIFTHSSFESSCSFISRLNIFHCSFSSRSFGSLMFFPTFFPPFLPQKIIFSFPVLPSELKVHFSLYFCYIRYSFSFFKFGFHLLHFSFPKLRCVLHNVHASGFFSRIEYNSWNTVSDQSQVQSFFIVMIFSFFCLLTCSSSFVFLINVMDIFLKCMHFVFKDIMWTGVQGDCFL